jgi:predicted HTH transcriptional regulator
LITLVVINKLMDIHSKNKILKFLKEQRVITSSELAKFLGVSWNTAEKYLLENVIDGDVIKIKKLGVNLWIENKD